MTNEPNDNQLETECAELRRGLSRLSFIGMGMSSEMDKALADLRKGIKKEQQIEDIQFSLNHISNILRRLDDQTEQKESNKRQIDAFSLILDKDLPKSLKKQLKKAKKQNTSDDANKVMTSIVDIVCQHLEKVEIEITKNNPDQAKKGFLGSLFSRSGSKEQPKVDAQSNENSIVEESSLSNNQPILLEEPVPQDVKDSLQHLIDQLASMDGYSEIAALLKKEVKSITQIVQLAKILEMITNAFVEISDQEHIQFEKFLKTLNTRIKRVNSFISDTLDYSQSAATDSQQLNASLNTNFSGMKDGLTNSKSLEDATSLVFSHLDQMTEQLDQYCETQQKNSEQLVLQMDKLSEQLRATEDEASRLKDDLAEQRVRAQTDPLTNLPNRYSYNERLTQEYNRWRRYRNSLTLVIADIDLFKQVNDEHGHAFGDKVLKEIASFLSAGVRESDFIARFGGEEFIILLPETNIIDATRAMNKIRLAVSKLEISHQDKVVPVTLSFGLSEFDNDDTTKAVFERADKALYRAKEKGRNRVCCLRAKSEE